MSDLPLLPRSGWEVDREETRDPYFALTDHWTDPTPTHQPTCPQRVHVGGKARTCRKPTVNGRCPVDEHNTHLDFETSWDER